MLDRWPSAGLAPGVARGGSLAWLLGHGVAGITTQALVTEDTVFRIGPVPAPRRGLRLHRDDPP